MVQRHLLGPFWAVYKVISREKGKLSGSRGKHLSLYQFSVWRQGTSSDYGQACASLGELGALKSSEVARSSKRRTLGAVCPSPLESACPAGSSVTTLGGWKALPEYLHFCAREGDRVPSMRAKISRPMMGKNCMNRISVEGRSSRHSAHVHLESMSTTGSRQQQARNVWMPIDQPMPISAIRVEAKTSGDEILGRSESREEFGIFRT